MTAPPAPPPRATRGSAPSAPPTGEDGAAPLRRLLHAVVVLGTVGLAVELLLLEHWDSAWQLAPLVLLAAAFVAALALWRRPGRATLRLLRGVMALCVAAGALGVWLHYDGNAEFERESDPTIGGLALFGAAVTGAVPALAPGALAQLGLLGLLLAWRHPADRRAAALRGAGAGAHGHRAPAPPHGAGAGSHPDLRASP